MFKNKKNNFNFKDLKALPSNCTKCNIKLLKRQQNHKTITYCSNCGFSYISCTIQPSTRIKKL